MLAWRKRIWRCREPACKARTWTDQTVAIRPRAVLTERTRAEACRRVGKDAHAVAAVARDLGIGDVGGRLRGGVSTACFLRQPLMRGLFLSSLTPMRPPHPFHWGHLRPRREVRRCAVGPGS
ncbi:MAG TPA: hypothetical protein VFA45_08110 [Actinomycetes bacterium]|nr:hypothetical protein [Actinomycetes bacterium]